MRFLPASAGKGDLPACVVTCPTKARVFGDINDPESDAGRALARGNYVRVINMDTDIRPNIYYQAGTAPLDWPVEAVMPTPIQIWKYIYKFLWGIVGLNILGVLVMLGKQLLIKDDHLEDQAKESGGK